MFRITSSCCSKTLLFSFGRSMKLKCFSDHFWNLICRQKGLHPFGVFIRMKIGYSSRAHFQTKEVNRLKRNNSSLRLKYQLLVE